MYIEAFLSGKEQELEAICRRHKVDRLYVYGSAVTSAFSEVDSDIDLIVSITEQDPIEKGELMFSLWESLEVFFGRKVDLMGDRFIQNEYLRRSIEAGKQLLYDARTKEVLS